MDWQIVFTWIAIVSATSYVLWSSWRSWRATKGGCSGGCGCSKSARKAKSEPALIAPEELILRKR
jgi:hypothetical protein